MPPDPTAIGAVALLDDRIRRSLYETVVSAGHPVGRDEAAAAVGASRSLAAFHLDRLVAGGLLTTEYRRLSGRSGPGAGRPAKLYRPADGEVAVSLPDRRYELAARLFATAIDPSGSEVPSAPVMTAARELGRAAAAKARRAGDPATDPKAGPGNGPDKPALRLMATLRDQGYAPTIGDEGALRLRNCPFHALVEDHRDLVCGMNLSLLQGLVEELGHGDYAVRFDRQPGWCCVVIDQASTKAS